VRASTPANPITRCTQLIRDKYPWFLGTFKGYPHGIQRADALRYFVLHEYGGVYLVRPGARASGLRSP